jgi:hypothetical protein
MKIKAYIQVSKTGKIGISTKPHKQPFHNNYSGRSRKYYPTVQFIVNFDIPNEAFELATQELKIALQRPDVLKEIKIEEEVKQEAMQSEAQHSSQARLGYPA